MEEIIQKTITYLRAVWLKRWYVVAIAWSVALIGWAVVLMMPDQYRANAKVYVDTQSVLRPLLRGLAVDTDVRAQVELMSKSLLTRPNLEKLMGMTDMDLKLNSPEEKEAAIEKIRSNVTFERDRGGPDIYLVSYQSDNPELSRAMVQSLLTIFMESSMGDSRKTAGVASQFLDDQIREYETKLADTEAKLKEFKQRNVGLLPGAGGDYFGGLQQAMSELEMAEREYNEARKRRDEYRRQLVLAEDEPVYSYSSPGAGGEITTVYDSRIRELETKIDTLLLKYTESHPDVITARRVLQDLRNQRDAERRSKERELAKGGKAAVAGVNPVVQQIKMSLASEEANLASLNVRLSQARQKVGMMRSNVSAGPEVEAELTALTRDYDIFKRNYQQLVERRETAKISQQVDTAGERVSFRVIEPPVVPLEPAGPNRPLLSSIVLLLGLAAGVGVAIILALLRPTFDSPRTLIHVTHLPVLGEVGLMLSEQETSRKKRDKYVFVMAMLVLIAVYFVLVSLQAAFGNLLGYLQF